jgi:hypothetical protein
LIHATVRLRQILSRGKRAIAGARHHDRRDVVVGVETLQCVDDHFAHRGGPRVQSCRPVQRDDCNAAVIRNQNVFAHVLSHSNNR